MPKSRVVRALGAKSAKKLPGQLFGTQHPANAKTVKIVRERPRLKIVMSSPAQWIGSELLMRPPGVSQGAPPVDPSGYWEESRHARLGTHHVLGVDMVCTASEALAERAERARSKFSAKRPQKYQNPCTPAQSSKSPCGSEGSCKIECVCAGHVLPGRSVVKQASKQASSEGSRSQNSLLEVQICRKVKTLQNFRSLRILGVEYAGMGAAGADGRGGSRDGAGRRGAAEEQETAGSSREKADIQREEGAEAHQGRRGRGRRGRWEPRYSVLIQKASKPDGQRGCLGDRARTPPS